MPESVITMDSEGRVLSLNPAAERCFGVRAEDVIGRDMGEIFVPESLREYHRKGLARYLETGVTTVLDRRVELSALRADGTEFPSELFITRLQVPGPPIFAGFIRDLEERRRVEQGLRESRSRIAEAAEEERRELVTGLRELELDAVIELLRERETMTPGEDRAVDALGRILEVVERLEGHAAPALLEERGLSAALAELAAGAAVPLAILRLPPARLPARVEAAAYATVVERMERAESGSGQRRVEVRITGSEGRTIVEVRQPGWADEEPPLTPLSDRLLHRLHALDSDVAAWQQDGEQVVRLSIPLY